MSIVKVFQIIQKWTDRHMVKPESINLSKSVQRLTLLINLTLLNNLTLLIKYDEGKKTAKNGQNTISYIIISFLALYNIL